MQPFYLFLSGEPVHFEIFIFNRGDAVSELVATQSSVQNWPFATGRQLSVWVRSDAMPGRYRIEVLPLMTDESDRQIRPQGSVIDFEVRNPSTPQDAAEVVLRKGYRAFLAGQHDDAEEVANDLLRMNPRSYAAFVLKGQIASARQQPAEKLEMYRAALAIAASNLDPWCTRCAGDLSVPSLIEGLQCLVRGVVCE